MIFNTLRESDKYLYQIQYNVHYLIIQFDILRKFNKLI